MCTDIKELKQRLDTINQLRIDRALAIMNSNAKKVYNLIPILLHYNHPLIPGYLDSNVPSGICCYIMNNTQQYYLNLIKSHFKIPLSYRVLKNELPITGIYSMGSTSSIGQNHCSDLDIWVCHQTWLDITERRLLQHKCKLLEDWALSLGVKINLFLIDENKFKYTQSSNITDNTNNYKQCMILLLDEFYRTAVRLAGKRIIWNLIPNDQEKDYNNYIVSLYTRSILMPNEWIDLGRLHYLSIEDYLDTSLYYLNQGIMYSPYKAILKIMLLEAYLWEYPIQRLLAKDIKQQLHCGKITAFGLDPYYMMLERITRYLQNINDTIRLDLVRQCFYLKVCERVSNNHEYVNWRHDIMSKLIQKWGWDEEKLIILDKYTYRTMTRLHKMHNVTLNLLLYSYDNIVNAIYHNSASNFSNSSIK